MPKAKPKVEREISADNQIGGYLHCKRCIMEWQENKDGCADGTSPATFTRLAVGWTEIGLQVWCERHECNVVHIDFEGCQHPANARARKPWPEGYTERADATTNH